MCERTEQRKRDAKAFYALMFNECQPLAAVCML